MNILKASAFVSIGAATLAAAGAEKRPNILFIFSDDHAVKSISAYDGSLNQTPGIDRIAKEGAIFKNSFCANSICAPSRACILTGKHSHKNGQLGNWVRFDGSQFTFPQLMQKNGYATALIGKWHLKSDPTGFDKWMVYPGQGRYYNPDYLTPEGKKQVMGYAPDVTTDLSIEWMKEQQKVGKPFVMMCQYKAPHRTWSPAPRHLNKYDDVTFPVPETFYDNFEGRNSDLPKHKMGIAKHMRMGYDLKVPQSMDNDKGIFEMPRMTPEQKTAWKKAYDPKNKAFFEANLKGKELAEWKFQRYIKDYLRCVAAVDENVNRLQDFLKESGLEENTIVIYSSDQGFYLGEHGWFDKRWMYEESFRMPLVMKWPGKIKPGTVVNELVQNIDYAPTFLEACGIEIPEEIQGKSLLPIVTKTDDKVDWRDALYYHYYDSPSEHGVAFQEGVRTDRYKLIRFYELNQWELYDLKTDKNETKNLYGNPEYSEIQKMMMKKLKEVKNNYDAKYDLKNPHPNVKKQIEKKKKKKK